MAQGAQGAKGAGVSTEGVRKALKALIAGGSK